MTQTISAPEETFASWRPPALKGHERRTALRKAPEQLIYLSLPSNNGGIVLDISEGGLGFHGPNFWRRWWRPRAAIRANSGAAVRMRVLFSKIRFAMELNQLKRQLKDLGERIGSLRGFL